MRRLLLTAVAVAAGGASCACAHVRVQQPQPEIVSTLNPHVAFVPATAVLVVRLHGSDRDLAWSYCAGETWEWGAEGISAHYEDCEPWMPGTHVQRTYEGRHRFHEPGAYDVKLYLGQRLVASERLDLLPRTGQ